MNRDPDLVSGETVQAETRAKLEQFALRFGFRALLTLPVVWATMGWIYDYTAMNLIMGVLVAGGLTAFYGIVFSDHLVWLQVRGSRWVLTDRRLILVPAEDPQAEVSLASITSVKRWLWWSLRVRLESGLALRLEFIESPAAFRDHLITAVARAKGEAP